MIRFNSRLVTPGDTFLCLPNAHAFVDDAVQRGAAKVIYCTREEMAGLAAEYFGYPSRSLAVVGVTGTNGKTTTTYLTSHILNHAGYKAYAMGTLSGSLTTPESVDIQQIMAEKRDQGYTHIIMEVSSIGIDQHRVDCIDFAAKLLTNITQDHLDYHKTFEAYKSVKEHFLDTFPGATINPQDYADIPVTASFPLPGRFNLVNARAATAICRYLGVAQDVIDKALSAAQPVPGRFEQVNRGQDFSVFVDYAHTPDGLQNILEGVRDLRTSRQSVGRIITVFGCGGDRDRSKRPLMGKVVEQLSDLVIVTSDNPRSEDPEAIIRDIIPGLSHPERAVIEVDRKRAIGQAISEAEAGDIVLIAGKGHETYQIIGSTTHHFDDREEAALAIGEKLSARLH